MALGRVALAYRAFFVIHILEQWMNTLCVGFVRMYVAVMLMIIERDARHVITYTSNPVSELMH